jgi:hypothetical protein
MKGKTYFAMHNRHTTSYRQGDQLFNSYGVRNNRHLITNYGFCMRNNKYNSLGFKVFVNAKGDEEKTQQHVKVIKLKKERLSEPLLQYLRANLLNSWRESLKKDSSIPKDVLDQRLNRMLISAPVDLDFELQVVSTAHNLCANMLKTKFPTTLEQDRKMLTEDQPWRKYLALTHRTNQKEILASQA